MRRSAYLAAVAVIGLAGPAVAGERGGVSAYPPCNQPISKLTLAQIDGCRESQKAAEDLVRLLGLDKPDNDRGVLVIRGHR